jgi:phage shock protein A
MAIVGRVFDLLKANINDLLDKAEDPEKMLKQIIIDMEEQLDKSTQGLGKIMASERSLSSQLQKAQADSAMWEQRAKTALQAGNEALARQALESKVKSDAMVAQYQKMRDEVSAQVNTAREQVNLLKSKLEEARMRQTMLMSRAQVAEAKGQIAHTLGSVDSGSAFAKMDKMERKIEEKEATADAVSEISGVSAQNNDPFAALEKQNSVDAELERLKKSL